MALTAASLTADPPAPPASRVRHAVCWLTIAATVPYLALKIIWICGGSLGVHGNAMHSHAFIAVNSLTVLMDGSAATAALSLVRPWGMRTPAPLMLFPVWAATGFLAPVVVGAPLSAIVDAVTGSRAAESAERAIAIGVGAVGVAPALVRIYWALYWALGGRQGAPYRHSSLGSYAVQGVFGAFASLGVYGVVTLLRRTDDRPILRTLMVATVGTGTMFCWGFWGVLSAILTKVVGLSANENVMIAVGSLQMVCGAVLAALPSSARATGRRRSSSPTGPGSSGPEGRPGTGPPWA